MKTIFFKGQPIDLEITLSGSAESLENIGQQHFFANGIYFFSPSQFNFDSNELTGAKYYGTFNLDFNKYAKPDGEIELVAFGNLDRVGNTYPIFSSNVISIKSSTSLPWVDPMSEALDLFYEFTDDNLTEIT